MLLFLFRNRVRYVDKYFDFDLIYIIDRIIGKIELYVDIKEYCFFIEIFDIIIRSVVKKFVKVFLVLRRI